MADHVETTGRPAQEDNPSKERLQLHVRCVPEEETVQLALPLPDGKGLINFNRRREDEIANTLRRLSLTLKKRRLIVGNNELPAGGQGAGSKKAKGEKNARHPVVTEAAAAAARNASSNGDGDAGGVTAILIERVTGKTIEVDGALNDDGWMRLCAREDSDASSSTSAGTEGVVVDDSNANSSGIPPTFIRVERGGGTGLEIDVIVNPPGVTSLESSTSLPMTGFAILAQAETEFATGESWEWLRKGPGDEQEGSTRGASSRGRGGKGGGRGSREGGFTQVVGTLATYTPVEADVGRRLMIRCTPLGRGGLRGRPVVRLLASPVRPAPEPGLLALRRQWLDDADAGRGAGDFDSEGVAGEGAEAMEGQGRVERRRRLRVVCYNILADMFCTSAHADEVLYPHCPKMFREADYRFQMVAREIRGYEADLIMLQECEGKTFEKFLSPALRHDGFGGLYLNKAGSTQEGEAMFYRRSVLELESRHDFAMRDAIPLLEEFKGLLKAFPFLSTMFETRLTTVAQVAVFRPASCAGAGAKDSSVRLIVANTHLYFHPDAAHIRLMQLVALMDRVSRLRNDLIARGLRPGVILGGDLNSPPDGPVRYLSGNLVGPDGDLWRNVDSFRWGNRFFDEVATSGSTKPPKRQPQEPTLGATPSTSEPSLVPSDNGGVVKECGPDSTSSKGSDPPRRPFLPDVPYLRLQLGLELASGTPVFTNFTPEFTDTLDYIFIERGGSGTGRGDVPGQETPVVMMDMGARGETEAVAPMPEEGTLRAMTPGLPAETFPSDHVSLVVDLSLTS